MLEPTVTAEVKKRLKREYELLDPFKLKDSLDKKVNHFFRLVNYNPVRKRGRAA